LMFRTYKEAVMAKKKKSGSKKSNAQKFLKFDKKLVLNQWLISLFEAKDFEDLAIDLKRPELEKFDEDNVSGFYHIIQTKISNSKELTSDILLAYDQNIVKYWKKITEKRNLSGNILYPKYFQYLSLLFTEIYLDRYFTNSELLLNNLNTHVKKFNENKIERDQVKSYVIDDLKKLAFWSATGSGKTLLMHVNIMQYKHYLDLHNRSRELNRTILLTPNEGLSYQHLEEFKLSGITAELFRKDNSSGLFMGWSVEIIDIHKLKDDSGDKTVAIDAFEGNNLVMVDEGHRGASGTKTGQWMQKRNQLCEQGFSFEYSATFGQAMKTGTDKKLEQDYVKCILFDYSYKYFYGDGYGKEYRILNLEQDEDEDIRQKYLTAALLTFYQQQKCYLDKKIDLKQYMIEHPLWIFVGSSVNAVRTINRRKVSDVIDILLFLANFVKKRQKSIGYIKNFLRGKSGLLLDSKHNDLFDGRFEYLIEKQYTEEEVFEDILKCFFNAKNVGALHVENLKGTEGEIAISLGDNEPFGVINVGDTSTLCKLCMNYQELVVADRDFSGSLFKSLNETDSNINILIGSKKFTEGWSSWRVSSMGLMNIGKNEGPQIIQLFGRGVRLKGFEFCLQRSGRIVGVEPPPNIELLETLNIFGIRADYMRQFKEYLEEEGLPTNEDKIKFILPVIKNLGTKKLKTIKLKDGIDFKRQGPKPTLDIPDEGLKKYRIILDWYPKIKVLKSDSHIKSSNKETREEGIFTEKHIAFMDMDRIYFELQAFKNERSWFNLNLSRKNIETLINQPNPEWYRLFIPKTELEFKSFDQVRKWEEIVIVLLKKYCDRFYKFKKAEFENDHLEYQELTEDDPNFINEYQLLIDKSRKDIVNKLEEINDLIKNGTLKKFEEYSGLKPIVFQRHLYQPLMYVKNNLVEIKPVSLNDGERDFVIDLQKYCEVNSPFFEGKELYLLRNMSRGRGVGFFEAGNFYPDFILWLLKDDTQYVNFVDPKGIRNLKGEDDPKIAFYKTIKNLETDLKKFDTNIILNSFIVSRTALSEVSWWAKGMSKKDFEDRHVFFQSEDKDTYIKKIITTSLS